MLSKNKSVKASRFCDFYPQSPIHKLSMTLTDICVTRLGSQKAFLGGKEMLCTVFHTSLISPQWPDWAWDSCSPRRSISLLSFSLHGESAVCQAWQLSKQVREGKKSQYVWESVDCTWITIFIVSSKHLISLVSTSILPFRNGLNPARSSAEGYVSLSLPEHDIASADQHRRKQQQRHSRQGPRSPSSQSLSVAVYLRIWLSSNSPGDISSLYSSTEHSGCPGGRHRARSGRHIWKQKSIQHKGALSAIHPCHPGQAEPLSTT